MNYVELCERLAKASAMHGFNGKQSYLLITAQEELDEVWVGGGDVTFQTPMGMVKVDFDETRIIPELYAKLG